MTGRESLMEARDKEAVMDEFQAMQACVDALYALTPEERERALRWLDARIADDIAKESLAAESVGKFLRRASRIRRCSRPATRPTALRGALAWLTAS